MSLCIILDSVEYNTPAYTHEQEKAVADSEIANLTMGLTFFPAAKDSIFKVCL